MARLAKLANTPKRHGPEHDEDISIHKISVEIYFAAVLSAVILSGTLLYLVEDTLFSSIPAGMLWAFKVTLGMEPDIMPETMLGESISILTFLFGLMLFGLLISVMGNSLNNLLLGDND